MPVAGVRNPVVIGPRFVFSDVFTAVFPHFIYPYYLAVAGATPSPPNGFSAKAM
jgi:hypothetical protein